jgi:hypothetical protein
MTDNESNHGSTPGNRRRDARSVVTGPRFPRQGVHANKQRVHANKQRVHANKQRVHANKKSALPVGNLILPPMA